MGWDGMVRARLEGRAYADAKGSQVGEDFCDLHG